MENIKEKMYYHFMDCIANKGGNDLAIIMTDKTAFVVDKKFEKLCRKVTELYLKKNHKKSTVKPIVLYALCIASLAYLGDSYAEDMKITKLNLNSTSYVGDSFLNLQKEYLIPKMAETRKNIEEELEKIAIEQKRISMYEYYLKEYSGYFHLDYEKVIELARSMTNDYVNFNEIINYDYDFTNPEASCMLFVYYLNRDELSIKLEDLGLTQEELLTTSEIETKFHDDLNEFYLSNGKKYSEFFGEVCDFFEINNKEMALAVSFLEVGGIGSYSSNNRNNFGGMKYRSGDFMVFPTPEAGIISMCGNYKKNFDVYNIYTMEELACCYVSGKKKLPNPEENKALYNEITSWMSQVSSKYYKICENYDYYFPSMEIIEDEYVLTLTN